MLRPYVILTLGGREHRPQAHSDLDGTDITGTANQYGLTLGNDVIVSPTASPRRSASAFCGVVMPGMPTLAHVS
jgi:hypothetical protein